MRRLILVPLRALRAALGETTAAAVERFVSLEPWFVRTGRSLARRSRSGGALYWVAQEGLVKGLGRRGHRYRETRIRNLPLYVDVTDATGRSSFFYSIPYEKAVVDAIITALKPGDVFLDVGAHFGYFSAVAARLVGASGRVIPVEPPQRPRAALRAVHAPSDAGAIIDTAPRPGPARGGDLTPNRSA